MEKRRVIYLDIVRGIAVITMFMQHCILVHEQTGGNDSILGFAFVLAGTAPAAPVFMLIMGIFMKESKASTAKMMFRGIKLMALGYLLNSLRFILPLFVVEELFNVNLLSGMTMTYLFAVDIFQLAGLSMILLAPLRKLSEDKQWFPVLMVLIAAIGPFLYGISTDNQILNIPLSHLWGISEFVFFPLVPWIIYPMVGMYGSSFFRKLPEYKEKKKLAVIAACLMVSGIVLAVMFGIGDYHRSPIGTHMLIMGFILLWFLLFAVMSKKLSDDNGLVRVMTYASNRLTEIYFVQWVLFGFSILVFDENALSDIQAAGVGLVVMVMTVAIVEMKPIKKVFRFLTA